MTNSMDVFVRSARLYFIPVETRVPLKFGAETLTHVTCARARVQVAHADGRAAEGWGETPLSVQWAWPSQLAFSERYQAFERFCQMLVEAWTEFDVSGHPIKVGHAFQQQVLPGLLDRLNAERARARDGGDFEPMPWLAALICCSAFDIALHDAYGILHDRPVYETYGPPYMSRDLSHYLTPAEGSSVTFEGRYPQDYLVYPRPNRLAAWHLVGGLDLLDSSDLTGGEPDDGYPVLLADDAGRGRGWIDRDGLNCLKVKLRGTDAAWDYQRLVRIGEIAIRGGVDWLTSDFNCTVTDPAYVNAILDRLVIEHPRIYGMLLYVEQPFPYDLEHNRIDVHSVSARKPLFMDESAHDWQLVRLGRELGWTGVALKTCKTQTGALLSLCWAKGHGMTLMVQDLTNPMLAQIPHVLLAAHAGTIMGVETNAMQFYPDASLPEEAVHPGLYRRRDGQVDLSTIRGPGFGYRLSEIKRDLSPAP
jgi:L-alanine-DL-glutamate epimerase-like enolase superfamily enzyme